MDVLDIMETQKRCVIRNSVGGCDKHCERCELSIPNSDAIRGYEQVIAMIQSLRAVTEKKNAY